MRLVIDLELPAEALEEQAKESGITPEGLRDLLSKIPALVVHLDVDPYTGEAKVVETEIW